MSESDPTIQIHADEQPVETAEVQSLRAENSNLKSAIHALKLQCQKYGDLELHIMQRILQQHGVEHRRALPSGGVMEV